jgi:hypothetical protein
MELAVLFLLLFVLGAIAFFVSLPFLNRSRNVNAPRKEKATAALVLERERILSALRDLEFDNSLGKIPEEDFPLLRNELMQKGAQVLRQLDELSPLASKRSTNVNEDLPGKDTAASNPLLDEDLEASLVKRRNAQKQKTAGFCPNCGKPIYATDLFCPSCGNALRK